MIGNVRVLPHVPANPVPAVFLNQSKASLPRVDLDRMADRIEPCVRPRRVDARIERGFRVAQQSSGIFGNAADRIGPSRVAVVALDDRADIDGDDVAFLQDSGSGNAVDDLVVDRGADASSESEM